LNLFLRFYEESLAKGEPVYKVIPYTAKLCGALMKLNESDSAKHDGYLRDFKEFLQIIDSRK
jgi:hypothetical protein